MTVGVLELAGVGCDIFLQTDPILLSLPNSMLHLDVQSADTQHIPRASGPSARQDQTGAGVLLAGDSVLLCHGSGSLRLRSKMLTGLWGAAVDWGCWGSQQWGK